jgi:F420-dependent oxidoreductase-like protein
MAKKPKFGLDLPINSGSSAWDNNLNFERMKKVTKICEELGFDSVWVPDHLMTGDNLETLEAWTVLSGLSQVTEKMRLGTLVACPTHRSPAMLAKIVATLDIMSNGRVDLGLGAGWNGFEQLAYGLPWEEIPKARIERLVETVKILKGLWTNDSFSFEGKYYNIRNAVCLPKPIQKPSPKILIGGKGEKLLLRVVARYADAWNLDEFAPDTYSNKLDVLRNHCNAVGRNYDEIEKTLETYLLISDNPQDYQRIVDWSTWQSKTNPERIRQGKPATEATLQQVKQEYIVGTAAQVTEKIAEYIDIGVQRFMIYFLDYPTLNSILPFAEQVIPSL